MIDVISNQFLQRFSFFHAGMHSLAAHGLKTWPWVKKSKGQMCYIHSRCHHPAVSMASSLSLDAWRLLTCPKEQPTQWSLHLPATSSMGAKVDCLVLSLCLVQESPGLRFAQLICCEQAVSQAIPSGPQASCTKLSMATGSADWHSSNFSGAIAAFKGPSASLKCGLNSMLVVIATPLHHASPCHCVAAVGMCFSGETSCAS